MDLIYDCSNVNCDLALRFRHESCESFFYPTASVDNVPNKNTTSVFTDASKVAWNRRNRREFHSMCGPYQCCNPTKVLLLVTSFLVLPSSFSPVIYTELVVTVYLVGSNDSMSHMRVSVRLAS